MGTTLRLIGSVFKLRIAAAITLCALGGVAVTPGAVPEAYQIAALGLAVMLSAASAGAFNQYVERDLDGRMRRTAGRPFVTGQLRAGPLWLGVILATLALAIGLAALALNSWVALHTFLGAFVYGVVYTVWLKRRTWLNIVLGGLAGSFAVLAGAATVDPRPTAAPILLAVVLFLWTPPHFWSLAAAVRDDYARAGVPMLPVVVGDALAAKIIFAHSVTLVLLSLIPGFISLGWVYLISAAVGGAFFVVKSWRLVQELSAKAAITNFFASLVQLSLMLTGAIADRLLLG
ncbi:MAG TPA: heme o synthase [Gammaproteobacteria bacterium]|nr:heme o synthase [Gammaproteobacteria bacterium]